MPFQQTPDREEWSDSRLEDLMRRMERLEKRVERLCRIEKAIWEELREELELDEARVRERVQQATTSSAAPCPKCGRPIDRTQQICLYCGSERADAGLFDGLI